MEYLSLKKVTEMHAEEIQQAVQRVTASGWYLQGEEVKAFEGEFASYIGRKHCVSCANGLDALILTLRAYKEMGLLTDGNEVIVPANTYIATILAITENNLRARLVEPDASTLQIDSRLIEQAITPRTKAVMLVHLYGINAFNDNIAELCRKHNLMLIEDCAQYHTHIPERRVGNNTLCFSFYPGKNLGALGDAGCVVTDDDRLAATVRTLANYGSSRKYVFQYQGRNSRMDELQAAVLRVKLRYLDEDNRRRQQIARTFLAGINNTLITLPPNPDTTGEAYPWHIFPVLCSERDRLQQFLKDNGIGTVIHYPIPPHRQEAYAGTNRQSLIYDHLPVTERIHNEELSLPCNQTMTDEDTSLVIEILNLFK